VATSPEGGCLFGFRLVRRLWLANSKRSFDERGPVNGDSFRGAEVGAVSGQHAFRRRCGSSGRCAKESHLDFSLRARRRWRSRATLVVPRLRASLTSVVEAQELPVQRTAAADGIRRLLSATTTTSPPDATWMPANRSCGSATPAAARVTCSSVLASPPANGADGSAASTAQLVNKLVERADERVLSRVVGRYGRLDLLCLDELGYVQIDPRGAELLFQIITEREERAPIAIATNLPFSEWGTVLPLLPRSVCLSFISTICGTLVTPWRLVRRARPRGT
jgi:hypothetical protein